MNSCRKGFICLLLTVRNCGKLCIQMATVDPGMHTFRNMCNVTVWEISFSFIELFKKAIFQKGILDIKYMLQFSVLFLNYCKNSYTDSYRCSCKVAAIFFVTKLVIFLTNYSKPPWNQILWKSILLFLSCHTLTGRLKWQICRSIFATFVCVCVNMFDDI
jgi:hypothetical protein